MSKVKKIPSLKCPKCGSTAVSKSGSAIDCSDCNVKSRPNGKVEKTSSRVVGHSHKRNYPEGYFQ